MTSINLTDLATWNPTVFSMIDSSTCKLLRNINLSDISMNSSGTKWTLATSQYINLRNFDTFDGSGYSMTINFANLGLFANTSNNWDNRSNIKNLNVINSAGILDNGGGIMRQNQTFFEINNCHSQGNISGNYAGGICGYRTGSSSTLQGHVLIQNCTNSGNIYGIGSGGICGSEFGWYNDAQESNIISCSNTGNIYGEGAGGICGSSIGTYKSSTEFRLGPIKILDCSSSGIIDGSGSGGICGMKIADPAASLSYYDILDMEKITVDNCNSSGLINGIGAGGICGSYAGFNNGYFNINKCYSIGDISNSDCGGICGKFCGYIGIIERPCEIFKCYSTGIIGQNSGGICGSYAAYNKGSIYIFECYSTGNIGIPINFNRNSPIFLSNAGGICGSYAGHNGYISIEKSHSKGNIYGTSCGGIVGPYAAKNISGIYEQSIIFIRGCYVLGNIGLNTYPISGYSAGIAGPYLGDSSDSIYGINTISVVIDKNYYAGEIYNNYCAGICAEYVGYYSRNSNSSNYFPVIISNCYSAAKSFNYPSGSLEGGGICGNYIAYRGFVNISNCYSVTEINNTDSGGICGRYSALDGSLNITNCYAENPNYGNFISNLNAGGIVGPNSGGTINITNCYFAKPTLDSSMNFYGSNSDPSNIFINNSYSDLSNIKYNLDPNWDLSDWVIGNIDSKFNIYPRLKTFSTFGEYAWDYKYMTNKRSPDYTLEQPYTINVNSDYYNFLSENQIIDLRNWIINYLQNIIYKSYGGFIPNFIMSKDSMGINKLDCTNKNKYICDKYLILNKSYYKDGSYNSFQNYDTNPDGDSTDPSFNPYKIRSYENYYDGYYFPLSDISDSCTFNINVTNVPSNTNLFASGKWTVTLINKFSLSYDYYNIDNKISTYLVNSDSSNITINDFANPNLLPFNLVAGGCTIQPRILKPAQITSVTQIGSGLPGNIIVKIDWNNNVLNSRGYFGYRYFYLYGNDNKWSNLTLSQLPDIFSFMDESNNYICYDNSGNVVSYNNPITKTCYYKTSVSSGKDKSYNFSPLPPGTTKFGYKILTRGDRINWWDSAQEYKDPSEYVLEFMDPDNQGLSGKDTDENFSGVFFTPQLNTKIITGGLTLQSSALNTPILNRVTNVSGDLIISWDFNPDAGSYKVIRYYYNNATLNYVYDSSFTNIQTNTYTDTTWDNTITIIGYSVIAISNSSNFTDSNESLKSPYINTPANIIMIADIPCYYELVGGVKVLHLADNPNLKNYFDQFSGSDLSNKRSEGFFNYFFTQASTEPYIKVEKSLLDFTGGAYSQPYYLVYNCDYFMETSHYIDVTAIDLTEQGIYVPLKDDKSYCIFYVNTNEPISDEASLIDTYIKVEKEIDAENILKFPVNEGIFDEDFNFIPLIEPTIYNLNDIFYMGEYVTIAGGVTINNKGPIPCLTKDAMILTPIGYINIQKLRKSDYVITDDLRKVKIKNILVTYSKRSIKNSPYIIHKNSIGKNYPPCTFKVSPSHLIKYKDKWIHPRDSKMFKQDLSESIIKYYHIELENYETDNLVINDGAIVESFGGYSKYANIYKERKYNIKKNNIK